MKNNLGKISLFILFSLFSFAKDVTYKFSVDNSSPFVKEGIILTANFQQTNKDVVLMLDFDLQKSSQYKFKRLDAKQTEEYHDLKVEYKYLIYPLISGPINIEFNLVKKITTDESVAYSFSGDRDNVKGLVTKNSSVTVNPVTIQAKEIPEDTQIVGDYTLKYKLNKTSVISHEPVNLTLFIQGEGFPLDIDTLFTDKNEFKIFNQKPLFKDNAYTYHYAFSHNENFTIPKLNLKAFSPSKNKSYTLQIQQQPIVVQSLNQDKLIDKIDSPKKFNINFENYLEIIKYIFIFFLGFISHKLFTKFKFRTKKIDSELNQKINSAKTHKELLTILIAANNRKFKPSIEKLEKSIYDKETTSLKQIKIEVKQ